MAIPSTGPISLRMIQTEFGGSDPFSLFEYYRGGGLVAVNSATLGIPASGAISIDDFRGKAASTGGSTFTVSVSPASLHAYGTGVVSTVVPAVATPAGQTGSVTYSWTRVSGDVLTVSNATSASTTFSATVGIGNQIKSAVYKCTATDSGGHVSSDTVDVTIEWDNGA